LECKRPYTIQIYDEFFPGYNQASFHRFQNAFEWALIPIQNTTKLFIDGQLHWNDTAELQKFYEISNRFKWHQSLLETLPITHIFIEGGSAISTRAKRTFEQITGKTVRHKHQVITCLKCVNFGLDCDIILL
jgi:hypothetical protein